MEFSSLHGHTRRADETPRDADIVDPPVDLAPRGS